MKKVLSVLMTVLLLCSMLCIATSAYTADEASGQVPTTKETITIDGVKDAVYDKGFQFKADQVFNAQADVADYADYYVLWKPEGLYIFIECHDRDVRDSQTVIDASGCDIWNTDHACLDLEWADSSSYVQYSMTTSSVMRMWSMGGGMPDYTNQENMADYMQGAVKLGESYGYNVELFLKANADVANGEELTQGSIIPYQAEFCSVDASFENSANSNNFNNQRYCTVNGDEGIVDDLAGNTHQSSWFKTMQLSNSVVDATGEIETLPEPETDPPVTRGEAVTIAPQETKAPTSTTPVTTVSGTDAATEPASNNTTTIIIIVVAVVVVAAVVVIIVVSTKKKK